MRPDTIKVLEWPVVEPVSLTEARQQVGLMADQTEFDAFLLRAIATGRRLIERRLGMTLVATQYRATWQTAPAVLDLMAPPVLIDEDHALVVTVEGDEVDPADYEVDADAQPATVTFDSVPSGKVVATYWAGVAPATEIEPTLKSALLMYVAHAFENRGVLADGPTSELPQGFETLLAASSWNGGW
jgi:uncharacterized phiE125 gp8 family phage protein